MLDRKADLELINRLQDDKAERTDILDFNTKISDINDKLRHMSVLTTELTSCLMPESFGKYHKDN